ncbi:hypothetical protein CPAV1605_70 [seawater metagenome]|uniref:Uncharacterized protein n=1 Tax=seawater metagenome TaxID=1561972 RepID=A0A5E8CFU5_9ZZZZ
MTDKPIQYYQDRLQKIREVLNMIYNFAVKHDKNVLYYIRSKFDYQLTRVNLPILQEGLKLNNMGGEFTRLSNKYVKVLQFLHTNKNQFIVAELKEEAELLELEKMLNTLPEIPNTLPQKSETEKKLEALPTVPTTLPQIKKKEPLLN